MSSDRRDGDERAEAAPDRMPERHRSHAAVVWLSALTVLAAIVAVVLVTVAPLLSAESRMAGEGVWWTADGAFVVVQLRDGDGVGQVRAWDLRTGRTGEMLEPQQGFRVVAVERVAPRVWVVPDGGTAAPEPSRDQAERPLAGDLSDAPPDRLLMWDLASGSAPTDDVESRWRPWPGSRHTAFLEIDVLKGSLPSRLLFQPSDGSTEGTRAQLPEAVTSFEPVGWSPSGEWFAVIGIGEDGVLPMMFSPEGGVVTGEGTPRTEAGGAMPAVWLPGSESLLWLEEDGGAGVLSPGGTPGVGPFEPSASSLLLGAVPSGPVIRRDDAVFALRASGEAPIAQLSQVRGIAYDPRGGLAVLEGDPLRLTVGPTGASGAERAAVWKAGE